MDTRRVTCITCQHDLLDTGKFAKDPHFVYCSVCYAYYQVVPITDEFGQFQQAEDGRTAFYLNPVRPGDISKMREPAEEKKPDFSDLLAKIQKAQTPKDLTD